MIGMHKRKSRISRLIEAAMLTIYASDLITVACSQRVLTASLPQPSRKEIIVTLELSLLPAHPPTTVAGAEAHDDLPVADV
jgi:hypothetical protein